jgi:hypothetical protein
MEYLHIWRLAFIIKCPFIQEVIAQWNGNPKQFNSLILGYCITNVGFGYENNQTFSVTFRLTDPPLVHISLLHYTKYTANIRSWVGIGGGSVTETETETAVFQKTETEVGIYKTEKYRKPKK